MVRKGRLLEVLMMQLQEFCADEGVDIQSPEIFYDEDGHLIGEVDTRYDSNTDPVYHRDEGTVFLKFLEERLAHHRQLFGDKPALADFALSPFVRQFANTDRDWFDKQPLPHLQKWLSDHLASDLFSGIMIKWSVWNPDAAEVIFPDSASKPR